MAKSKSSMIIDAGNTTNHAKKAANKLNQNSKLDMLGSIVFICNNVERRNKNIIRMKDNKLTNRRFG